MRARIFLVAFVVSTTVGAAAQDSPAPDGVRIVETFEHLDASTRWRLVRQFKMDFDTFHPQGMTMAGEKLYVSAVEVIDRAAERGKAHLFEADLDGTLLRRLDLTDGARYHPGGIDFDGEVIWVPVAEYKPNSSAVIFAVDPKTLEARRVLAVDDHLGGVVHNRDYGRLIANSWGSRRFYRWKTVRGPDGLRVEEPARPEVRANRSHYIDLQDGQWLPGTNRMVCSGLRRYRAPGRGAAGFALGGMELLATDTLEPIHQVPILLWENEHLPMTQNAVYVRATRQGVHFYFMPADNRSTVHVYEPRLEWGSGVSRR